MIIHSDPLLDRAVVAVELDVCKQTVQNLISRGKLPAVRVGGRVKVRRSDLARFVAELPARAPTAA
jgi:excisionase family DNA binding protein